MAICRERPREKLFLLNGHERSYFLLEAVRLDRNLAGSIPSRGGHPFRDLARASRSGPDAQAQGQLLQLALLFGLPCESDDLR